MVFLWAVLAAFWWVSWTRVPEGEGGWFLAAAVIVTVTFLTQLVHDLIQANRVTDEIIRGEK